MSIKVSVVLPTYNVRDLLAEAIASVCGQTFPDWELLVVDDGSSDDSVDLAASWPDARIRVIRSEHTGNPALLRNRAVALARGDYVAFIDADDLWEPEKLQLQIDGVEDPGVRYGWCYSNTLPLDQFGHEVTRPEALTWTPWSGMILRQLLLLEARVPASSVVVRRNVFNSAGGFDPEAVPVEDYDLWFRLAPGHEALAIDRRLCRSRSRPAAFQADRVAAHRAWQRAYRRAGHSSSSEEIRAICREMTHRHGLSEALHLAARRQRAAALRVLLRAIPEAIVLRVGWRALGLTLARIVHPSGQSV